MSGTGVWLAGVRGSVATTAIIGALAVRAGLAESTGLVSERPGFPGGGLPELTGLVFGGHDPADVPLAKRAEQLAHAGLFPADLPARLHDDLAAVENDIVTGGAGDRTRDPAGTLARLSADIAGFRDRHALDRVVVVNVTPTEPPTPPRPEHATLAALRRAIADGAPELPASACYAYAAFEAGCGHVDFTPSVGARLPALDELARERAVPYAGNDGKTGETLLKAVLAPMFAGRNLRVNSWSGTNLLGGGDGANLADARAAESKLQAKGRLVGETLGYPVEGPLHIDYVADLGEQKTAWDHVTFQGFLGARMSLQFTWQGYDSALAAPLVLDLARFVAAAHAAGRAGPLPELAYFFKDPIGTGTHDLAAQYERLRSFAAGGCR
ncbi:inositol-3-phosphate synthase [Actinomadura rugatobispora]|uniref:Inositol-3-phosphate synthase n=1 Tax=Actinomadura rugatobispora TaxID=1994 RepID=A0ABW1A393_9ACTN|nr:inositol-3-phosphate synthase [Actinomadura rugatobispora]